MKRVVTFGELMLRLAPNGYNRFFQNDQMQATFGGGEANVAVSLANYGLDSVYITKLPKHAIGEAAVNSLRYFGVDTSKIVRGGDRVGIYYLEKGASQRGSVCIYDRAHSAIAEASSAYTISYVLILKIDKVALESLSIFQPLKYCEIFSSIASILSQIPNNKLLTLSVSSSSQIKLS